MEKISTKSAIPGLRGNRFFDLANATNSSPLYNGPESPHFLIFDALRDDPGFQASKLQAVITDGNQFNSRVLTTDEQNLREKHGKRHTGKPKGVTKKPAAARAAASSKSQRVSKCVGTCSDKVPEVVFGRTGGLYISMDAGFKRTESQVVVELREFLHNEDNALRSTSLKHIKKIARNSSCGSTI